MFKKKNERTGELAQRVKVFALKQEGNSDICYNIDKPSRHYVDWNKPDTK